MMNKYQTAYQNVQIELPVDNKDIVVLRELVDMSIPKQVEVLTNEIYVLKDGRILEDRYIKDYLCPECDAILSETNRPSYCPMCGQSLSWDHSPFLSPGKEYDSNDDK